MNEHVRQHDEDSLWRTLNAADDTTTFENAWLTIQASLLEGCTAAALWRNVPGDAKLAGPVAATTSSRARTQKFKELADAARSSQDPVVEPDKDGKNWLVAYPIRSGDAVVAIVVVEVAGERSALKPAIRQLQWGGGWLRPHRRDHRDDAPGNTTPGNTASGNTALGHTKAGAITRDQGAAAIRIFATTLSKRRFQSAATALAVEFAQRFALDRASIGIRRGHRTRVVAVSHAVHADNRAEVVRRIEAAMDEAADQRATIVVPPDTQPDPKPNPPSDTADLNVTVHAAQQLQDDVHAAAAVPLTAHGETIGAMVLQRAKPFRADDQAQLEAIATLIGPVLYEKRLNDRSIFVKVGTAVLQFAAQLVGAGHVRSKLAALAVAGLCLLAIVVDAPYQVAAPAAIEARPRRVVSIPFDGYLESSERRAGDIVRKGDVLARLDVIDLGLERNGLVADRREHEARLQAATAEYKLAQVAVARAQIAQIDAKLRLVDRKLSHSIIRAPIDGIIIAGDLNESVGKPLATGEAVFELAPRGSYRLVVEVSEFDVAAVAVGQSGGLVLAGVPEDTFSFEVSKVSPVLESKDGRSYYRVEARLGQRSPALRPGFKGRARINAGRKPLWWLWFHNFLRWLRLQIWTYQP
ncbi:MAG: efflux RND transporter periplasmic adaptor subunit [Pseudomonadota bacterium]